MKRLFPLLLLVFTILLFFQPVFLRQLLPIPADTIIGLYHPFRDLYAPSYPRGIPYKNFLITDPVLQQYPWKTLVVLMEKSFKLPLWNPYSFSGMPLLANLQSATFYPFNLFFFLLPFPIAWSIFIIIQPFLAGIFMYFFLRNLRLSYVSSVFGGLVFAFSGFSTVWLEWGNVVQTGLWLPLILLSIDKLLEEQKKKFIWSLLFVCSLSSAFFAGHLQIFFYIGIVSLLYLLARMSQYKKFKKLFLFIFLFFLLLALTTVQWIPLFQLIQLSARNVDHIDFRTPGWFVPWQHLIQFIAPDFFGNPATLNYWGIWNYMEFSGYVGLLPLFFALFALFFVRMKKVYFFGFIVVTSLLFALPTPLAVLPFVLHIPFIETSQPTRLLFLVDFGLAILAAIGLSSLRYFGKKIWGMFMVLSFLLILPWAGVFLRTRINFPIEQAIVSRQNLIFPTIVFFSIFILLGVFQVVKNTKRSLLIFSFIVIIITCFDLFRFAYKFTPFVSAAYLFPSTKTLTFLKGNERYSRIMETSREILSPNISIMYSLYSVDGYDPLYLERYGEYIAASERGKPDIKPPFGFNRIITPHNYESPLINLLGVKYILSLQDLNDKNIVKVFEEGQTKVYENTSVIPRVFFVSKISHASSKQAAMDFLFINKNDLSDAAVVEGGTTLGIAYSKGSATIENYSPTKIVIKTENSAKGFLVLTDVYYPTWHAFVDGKQSKIFLTDFTFRGLEIPKGSHTIIFEDSLL